MNIKNIALITLTLLPTISNSAETPNPLVTGAKRIASTSVKVALANVLGVTLLYRELPKKELARGLTETGLLGGAAL